MFCRLSLFLVSVSLFAQVPFTQFVVFGDSLSDNGNLYLGLSQLGESQFGPVPPMYATGEYTDGTNSVPSTSGPLGLWIEQLATKMNLPVPQPFENGKGGTNFAVASALTGANPSYSPATPSIPYLTDQLNIFLSANHTLPANTLYVFWGGGDDIRDGVNPVTAVANVQGNIDTLATAGAKYFFWANLPPLGEVPEYINTSNRSALDAASVTYNIQWSSAIAQLKAKHPGIIMVAYDAYAEFASIAQNPSLYGFTNVTSPAQGLMNVNPNTYLFWDMLHPTTAADADIASSAYNAIETAFGSSGAQPASPPSITSVGNAFGNSSTIAPNTWVAIKGLGLDTLGDWRVWQTSDFANNQLPTGLDSANVMLNGEDAYVYYISPTQLNILTPPDLAAGPVQVQVTVGSQKSTAFAVQAQTISPSFFVFDGTHVVAQHLNYTDVGPTTLYPGLTTPAQPGETIILYANGFGATSSPVVKGAEQQSGTLPALPLVQIGGMSATVQSANLISPGLYQFNVVVPMLAPNGDDTLMAQYDGQSTQTGVVITVQNGQATVQ
ncbi:MAG: SGNH/GDSL hydrolase family protein [Bryobacteraceae bacterium]|jgi:uncharacterized protein (TIGR03437 family)